MIGKRRHCKGNDHGRCFREHFVDCPSDTLKALSSQYEALTMLRDLSVQANLARPPAATLGQSLAELFVSGCCSDIDLVYRGHRIPAHRTILMARCPYFRYVCNRFYLIVFQYLRYCKTTYYWSDIIYFPVVIWLLLRQRNFNWEQDIASYLS